MANKINPVNDTVASISQLASKAAQTERNQREPGATATPGTVTVGDSVQITGTAATLKRIEANLADVPVIDAKRVERIRGTIVEGSYRVDPQRVAEKLLEIETQRNGVTRPGESNPSGE